MASRRQSRAETQSEPPIDGRAPPHDLEAEAAVLSAVMLEATALDKVLEFLKPEHFYSEAHRRIFEASLELRGRAQPVDVVTVGTWLKDRGRAQQIGGLEYLASILNQAPAIANVGAYGRTIHEKWRVRELIRTCQRVAAQGYIDYGAAQEFIDESRAAFDAIAGNTSPWTSRLVVAPSEWHALKPPKREWLLHDSRSQHGVLPRGAVGMVAAAGGAGKTMGAIQAAIAIATCTPWLGVLTSSIAGRVLLVLGEETSDECHRRLHRAARAMGAPPWIDGSIVTMPLAGVECALIATSETGDAVTTAFHAWLVDHVKRERYDLVVIDPTSRFGGREVETSNAAATRYVQALESIAATGSTVLACHHTPQWARSRGVEADTTLARGVTGLSDGVRWMATMIAERCDDMPEQLREVVRFAVPKNNYGPRIEPIALRRDLEHGGALVLLDATDLAMLAERPAPSERRDERRRAKASSQEAERRDRDAQDDAAVRAILAETPDIKVAALRAIVRGQRGCGGDRAAAAISRVRRVPA